MKIHLLVAALVASVALAAPADAASKKKKKTYHRQTSAVQYKQNGSYDVYVGNELVGRDPDPSIRAFMRRNPHIWDGPE
jgi:hypothetical protein